ncbi:TPA: divergent polysaccharide deacetylase family protein [Candidatus Poribacteria bacterium]|nr:divergent polysaccharide deacetylase family protein [Candidatus Poribacteria bacterium]
MIREKIAITLIIIGLVLIGWGAVYDLAARLHNHADDTGGYSPQTEIPLILPRISIIIDDMGRNTEAFERLVNLKTPITFSFLPGLPFTEEQSLKARAMGFDVMLHLPMEPKGYPQVNPGKPTVLCGMSDSEIERAVEKAIKLVPAAIGVDNHMGSKATEDERVMSSVLGVLKRHGLFFLDSLTTNRSVGYKLAKRLGVPTARNDLFIDNVRDTDAVLRYLNKLADIARRRGYAIGIGHPYPETISALERNIPRLKDDGIRFVSISELVR